MSSIHVQICESNMICPQSDLERKSECPKPSLGTQIYRFCGFNPKIGCSKLVGGVPHPSGTHVPGWRHREAEAKHVPACGRVQQREIGRMGRLVKSSPRISQDRMIYCKEMQKWKFRKKMGGKFYMFR